MPYAKSGMPQKKTTLPGIRDVYRSGDVFVNNVQVALWQPSGNAAPFQLSVAPGTVVINGMVVYQNTPEGINSLVTEESKVSPSLPSYHEDTPGQIGPGGQSPSNQEPPPPPVVDPNAPTATKYYDLKDSKMQIEEQMGLTKEQIEANWLGLCKNILDVLKDRGFNFKINSGFRTLAYNRKIGSSDTSDHTIGCAADLSAGSQTDNIQLFKELKNRYPYSQLIFEGNWVHVAYNGRGPKRAAKVMYTFTGTSPQVAGERGEALPSQLA